MFVVEVATERWGLQEGLQEGSDSLEAVVFDLQGQQSYVEVRKACEELG